MHYYNLPTAGLSLSVVLQCYSASLCLGYTKRVYLLPDLQNVAGFLRILKVSFKLSTSMLTNS